MRVRSSSKLAMLLVAGFPFVSDGCPPIEILLRLMTQAAYGSTAEIYIPADCPAHLVCASPTCFIASENGSFERGRKQREEPGLDPIRPNRWRPGGPARLTAESFKSCQGFYSLFLHDRDTLRQQAFQVIDYDDLFPPGLAARPTRLRVGASFAATSGETAPRTFKTTVFTFSGLDPDSFPAGTDPYTYAAQALSVETASVTADQSPSVSWVPVEGAHALPPETDLIVLLLEYELSGDLSRYTVYVDGVQAVLDAGPYGPTAAPDFAVTDAGEPVDVDVLANDRDPDGVIDPATLRVVVDPPNGITEIIDGGRAIRYTPDPGFTGDDAFSYVFADADGLNAGALATVT
ncbi:MAG: Ig-like domain-containing protein, partial [Rhodothermales bacterium]|nr:Ig-like domain-containing protein [Rhodothermales bacterium]